MKSQQALFYPYPSLACYAPQNGPKYVQDNYGRAEQHIPCDRNLTTQTTIFFQTRMMLSGSNEDNVRSNFLSSSVRCHAGFENVV